MACMQYKRAGDAMPTKNELMASTEESGINNVSVYGAASTGACSSTVWHFDESP